MSAAAMPSLEKHEGWGNQFVVLHEAANAGRPGPTRNGKHRFHSDRKEFLPGKRGLIVVSSVETQKVRMYIV